MKISTPTHKNLHLNLWIISLFYPLQQKELFAASTNVGGTVEGVPDGGPRYLFPHFLLICIQHFSGTGSSPPPLLATWRANGWMPSRTSRESRRPGKTTYPLQTLQTSSQEVWRGCRTACWSPAYSGELARVPGVHLQEDHPLRRLLTNVGV